MKPRRDARRALRLASLFDGLVDDGTPRRMWKAMDIDDYAYALCSEAVLKHNPEATIRKWLEAVVRKRENWADRQMRKYDGRTKQNTRRQP